MGDIVFSQLAKDLIINIINIIVLFVIVKALVYKPVKKFLDERTKRVQALGDEAKNAADEAQKTLDKRDEIIAQAESQAEKIINASRKQAAEIISSSKENAEKDAEEMLKKAKIEIENERKAIIEAANDDICTLAVDMAEKILSREVNKADNEKIIQDFFAEQAGEEL